MSEELKKWQESASKGIYDVNQEKWNISTVWNILTAWQRSEYRLSAKLEIAIDALEFIGDMPNVSGNPMVVSAYVVEKANKTLEEIEKIK